MDIQRKIFLSSVNDSKSSTKVSLWFALILLLASYIVLGIFLAELPMSWLTWEVTIIGTVLVTGILNFPRLDIQGQVSKCLKTDISIFIVFTIFAALISVILLWLHIFLKVIVILAAEILTRLELHRNNLSENQSFWLLMVTSLIGFSIGWSIHSLI